MAIHSSNEQFEHIKTIHVHAVNIQKKNLHMKMKAYFILWFTVYISEGFSESIMNLPYVYRVCLMKSKILLFMYIHTEHFHLAGYFS